MKKRDSLPGGKHAQWDNLSRTHAQFERDNRSLFRLIKKQVRHQEFWWDMFWFFIAVGCFYVSLLFMFKL